MPANRVAVIGSVLGAVAAFLTAMLGAFEGDLAKAVVASVALIVAGVVVVVFLLGAQKHEARAAAQGVPSSPAPVSGDAETVLEDPPPLNVPAIPPAGEPS